MKLIRPGAKGVAVLADSWSLKACITSDNPVTRQRLHPDASVVIKWLVPEEGSSLALSWLRQNAGTTLVAPWFLTVEVASVLRRKSWRGELDPTKPSDL